MTFNFPRWDRYVCTEGWWGKWISHQLSCQKSDKHIDKVARIRLYDLTTQRLHHFAPTRPSSWPTCRHVDGTIPEMPIVLKNDDHSRPLYQVYKYPRNTNYGIASIALPNPPVAQHRVVIAGPVRMCAATMQGHALPYSILLGTSGRHHAPPQ